MIIINKSYNPNTNANDIALLKLKEKVDLRIYTPACLPPKGKTFVDQEGWVYGWGEQSYGSRNTSDILKQTSQTILSNAECNRAAGKITNRFGCQEDLYRLGLFPEDIISCETEKLQVCKKEAGNNYFNCTYTVSMSGTVQSNMLCGRRQGTDSCRGDSGGPFTVEERGQHVLAGVVSFGVECARVGQSRRKTIICDFCAGWSAGGVCQCVLPQRMDR